MNDLITAAQQALAALKQSETTVPYEGFGMARREAERKHQAAITALETALAESVLNPAPGYCKHCKQYTIEEPLPAEAVEPVAWMDPASGDVISDARHEAWERDFGLAGKGKAALFTVPIYTAPPQRKPLTQEEIAAEWRKASECAGKSEGAVTTSQFVEMFARGVEAKHGIKESP